MGSNTLIGLSGIKKIWIAPMVNIYLAQGIEFTNNVLARSSNSFDFLQPKYLRDSGLTLTYIDKYDIYRYKNDKTNIIYFLRIVTKKEELKKCLEEDEAIVVYSGHARYGRGPCFGDSPSPGQAWGDGDSSTGIFYMGYRYLGVPVAEMLHHKYKAWLVPESEAVNSSSDLHPWIRKKKFISMTINDIKRTFNNIKKVISSPKRQYLKLGEDLEDIKNTKPSDIIGLNNYVAGNYDLTKKYWCYRSRRNYKYKSLGKNEIKSKTCSIISVVLRADWKDTKSDPFDLGKTNIKCQAFCHFGCNTLVHHRNILRKKKGWRFNGNRGYAFMTTAESAEIDPYWLYNFMTGPHDSIKENLIDACSKTNKKLYDLQKKPGYKYWYNYRIQFVKNIQQNNKGGPDLCRACSQKFCKS